MQKQMNALKKQLILECASKNFKESGYEKTSIDKISKELQVGVGTIYSFFGSKEGLFVEHTYLVIKQAFEDIKKELEGVSEPLKKLEVFINYKMTYFEKNKEILSDYLNNNLFFVQNTSRGKENPMKQIYIAVAEVIKEIFEKRKIKYVDYLFFAYLLDGIINSFIERYGREDINLSSRTKDVIEIFLRLAK